MKRTIILFIAMALFSGIIVVSAPVTAEAQRSHYYVKKVHRNGRVKYVRARKPSYYRRHRNRINLAIGTGAGALLGGLIGGGKGALIGAGAGLGSSALYTYVWNKKKRKYVKVRRY
ncbi:MAG: hypothetical protein IT173_09825 [Acidobacteria bacterium]|nr:hypothetical protein [Acidobacteriota bacterium]